MELESSLNWTIWRYSPATHTLSFSSKTVWDERFIIGLPSRSIPKIRHAFFSRMPDCWIDWPINWDPGSILNCSIFIFLLVLCVNRSLCSFPVLHYSLEDIQFFICSNNYDLVKRVKAFLTFWYIDLLFTSNDRNDVYSILLAEVDLFQTPTDKGRRLVNSEIDQVQIIER